MMYRLLDNTFTEKAVKSAGAGSTLRTDSINEEFFDSLEYADVSFNGNLSAIKTWLPVNLSKVSGTNDISISGGIITLPRGLYLFSGHIFSADLTTFYIRARLRDGSNTNTVNFSEAGWGTTSDINPITTGFHTTCSINWTTFAPAVTNNFIFELAATATDTINVRFLIYKLTGVY